MVGIVGLVVLLASGCTGTTGHLAAATTRAVDLRSLDLDKRVTRHVVGRSCVRVITVVPLGMPKMGDALDDALRRADAEVLSDVRVGYEVFVIPFVYAVACYVVEGDAS